MKIGETGLAAVEPPSSATHSVCSHFAWRAKQMWLAITCNTASITICSAPLITLAGRPFIYSFVYKYKVNAAAGASQEDVKGPHAALAVRLSQRDPGRSFVLGERLQYVLLPGARLQARTFQSVHASL